MMPLTRAIDAINECIGRAVAWCTLLMVLAQAAIVVLRYVFSVGSIPLQESVWYLHALVFMLGAGYTLLHGGHVRIDILYGTASPRKRALIDLFGVAFFLLPLCALLIELSLPYVAGAWRVREGSPEAGGLPFLYLLKTLIPITAALLMAQGLSLALKSIIVLRGERPGGRDNLSPEL